MGPEKKDAHENRVFPAASLACRANELHAVEVGAGGEGPLVGRELDGEAGLLVAAAVSARDPVAEAAQAHRHHRVTVWN